MSDDDLERELAARDHDEAARSALLAEAVRRLSHARSRPNWVQWATLALVLVALVFSAIAAFPVLENLDDRVGFDF